MFLTDPRDISLTGAIAAPMAEAFASAMAALGPFEPNPHVAVAVSGGADSLALCLLAAQWAAAANGRVTAVTVDHQLRPESAAEAAQVGGWLAGWAIPHVILRWEGDKPTGDLQAAARTARYRLLGDWCRSQSVLHLLVAHHQEDQAETVLMRLTRGSGLEGLAAMRPQAARSGYQLLRPLLSMPRAALRQLLSEAGLGWIDDPSNQNDRFDRVRWRKKIAMATEDGLSTVRLAETAAHLGRARDAVAEQTAALAAQALAMSEAGFARLNLAPMRMAPREIVLRLLASLCRTIAGSAFPPRFDGVERLWDHLCQGDGTRRSLGGCLIARASRDKASSIRLVYREPAVLAPSLPVTGSDLRWDGRFRLRMGEGVGAGWRVGALGCEGWVALRRARVTLAAGEDIPAVVRPSLPALWDDQGVLAVPHLGYCRPGMTSPITEIGFSPSFSVTGAGHCLVPHQDGIMLKLDGIC